MATTLEMLLAQLGGNLPAPAPSMPLPVGPPPVTMMPPGPPPDMAPAAPLPAADAGFIGQYAGPAPTAPVLEDPTLLDKIAAILGGAAFGPQYGKQLREERDEPIRRYERQLEQFTERRTRGVELDERRRERQQERATREAERKADREFEMWAQRARITDETALLQARQAFDLQKLREQERIADERQAKQLQAAQEKDRRNIEQKLATEDGAPSGIAKEISEYMVGLRPELSTSAQKWRGLRAQKLAAQLARVGSGSGGGGQVMARLATGDIIPASLVNREAGAVMLNGQSVPVVEYIGGNIPARRGREPLPGEPGGPQGPLVPASAKAPQASAPTANRAKAKAKLVANGYKPAEADAELDRLGIQ